MRLDKQSDVVTLYASRSDASQNCGNCSHRSGISQMFWKCLRTGQYTDIEMRYGGRCSKGDELRLRAPRRTFIRRAVGWLLGKEVK